MLQRNRNKVQKTENKYTVWQNVGMFFFKRKVFTTMLLVAVLLYGGLSYTTFMRREGFPSVTVALGIVRVIVFKDNAATVDKDYTSLVVEKAKALNGVKSVSAQSTAQGGGAQISFEDGTDVTAELVKLQQSVQLPSDAQAQYVTFKGGKQTSDGDDILISVHAAGASAQMLDFRAEKLSVYLKANLPLAERVVPIKLVEQTVNPETGTSQSAQIRFDRFYDSTTGAVLPSAIVAVRGLKDVDQLKLYDQVEEVIGRPEVKEISPGVGISADFAEGIREQVSGLQQNLLEGLIVVLIVSFILISWRASLITALAMSTTVIVTVGVLNIIGYSLNTITLFSLILSLALIVDDTTIIIEAIDAGLRRGETIKQSVITSLKKVALPSSTGTLTTILAFAPMLFIGGILGKFVRAIPITIIVSLVVSLIVSVVFIPVLMRLLEGKGGHKLRKIDPANHVEESLGNTISSVIVWSGRNVWRSIGMRTLAVIVGLGFIAGGVMTFKKVEFNIFPAPKDGIEISLTASVIDRENESIEQTQIYTDKIMSITQRTLGSDLDKLTITGQGGSGDANGFGAAIKLSGLKERKETSVQLAKRLQAELESLVPEMRIVAEASGVGPPGGSFEAQITDSSTGNVSQLIIDMKSFLATTELVRLDGTKAKFTDVSSTPSVLVLRNIDNKIVSVTAGFNAKDTSTLVDLAQKAIKKEFSDTKLASYGLSKDSLKFELGQEQDNQDSFASMGKAAPWLFLAMFVLMAVLFRSLLQPLLIFTALPFALFGVANGLFITKNPISFFAVLGIFALIGISVNNTILLTDYANKSKKSGKSTTEAIAGAMRDRLRPLLTTSITSILALLPLAINDPFWQGLAYTIVFGLISSTVLVLLVFPYYFLINNSISRVIHQVLYTLLSAIFPGYVWPWYKEYIAK